MAKFTFLVRKPRGPWPKEGLPAFVLEQDNWNDFGFQTQYRLSYATLDEKGRVQENLIGPIKILRAGQSASDGLLIDAPFNRLNDDFCSVGNSLDYYERVNKLPPAQRRRLLEALRDVVADPERLNRFRKEEGWKVSLFRYEKDESYLLLARGLLTGDYSKLPGDKLQFSFAMPGWHEPTKFEFSAGGDSSDDVAASALPDRIAVLVGRNGSGKSTLLARLARVALGTVNEREKAPLRDLGVIEPEGIGFPRVITVTFSPFDSFRLPGFDGRDRRKILDELTSGEGRFGFIGLRDIAAEGTRVSRDQSDVESDGFADADRVPSTRLKSIQQLTLEFERFLVRVREKKRTHQLNRLFESLLEDSAFSLHLEEGISNCKADDLRRSFLLCSTGHKIVALVICGLVATLEKSSLVLIDEPETHLHPPLLASMMHAMRKVLKTYESFCVVATHSPVVVQESLATHVKLVRRAGAITIAKSPKRETFGESIGLITSEVFGLNAEATDYHKILNKLLKEYDDQDEMEALFLNGQMSHQARSYVMARRLQSELDKN